MRVLLNRSYRFFLSLSLILIHALSFAQEIKVVDEKSDDPLIGANITIGTVDGSNVFYTTDNKGSLILNASLFENRRYVRFHISYIGYQKAIDSVRIGESKLIKLKARSYAVDDVVITAQYSPTSIDNSIHKVKVISRDKIDKMAAVNLEDVLSNELNVRISQDNVLGSGMSLQGISGQNVKIMIDGVPVIGRLDGQIDLNQINLNDVERIEIVEGPLSVNYGSNALAGTINIITKKQSEEKIGVGLSAYTENIGHYNIEARLNGSFAKKHSYRLSVGRNYFDGWSSGDPFWPDFSAQLADSSRVQQWNPKEQYFGRLQYNYQLKDLTLTYKGEIFSEKISNYGYPRRTINSIVAFDDYYYTNRVDNALFLSGKVSKNFSINWTAAFNDFERIKESRRKDLTTLESNLIPESGNNDTQDTSTFQLWMSRGSIARSKDSSFLNYEVGYDINLENASGERIEGGEQFLGDYAAFASAEINLTEDLVLKPALRYAYNTKYDAPITPAVNLKYSFKNSSLRFSYAKGFRAPSLKELYFNFNDVNHSLFGNKDLKAERSNNYTASVQQKMLLENALIKGEVSAFFNEIYNQINFAQSSFGGGDTLVYFNIGENRTKGLNASLSAIYDNWQFSIGGSYIGKYNLISEEEPIDEYSYTLEWVGNASYTFAKQGLSLSLFFKHQGELPGFGYDVNGEVQKQTIESYQLVDFTLNKKFWDDRIQMVVGVKNLFDVTNVQANLSSGAHSGGGNSISIGTGRTVFIKTSINLSRL